MELSNLFKMFLNHKKGVLIGFVGFWFLIGCILFIPLNLNDNWCGITLLVFFFSSIFFSAYIGRTLYGQYGKTFVLIQNNRKCFALFVIIIGLLNSLLLTLIACFLRLNTFISAYNPVNFNLIILLFSFNFFIFNLGCLYGLFVKYNRKLKKVIFYIALITFTILGVFTLPVALELVEKIVNFKPGDSLGYSVLIFNLISVISVLLSFIYYNKMNIKKVYSK